MNNFTQRLITGIVFVAVIIGAVMWQAYSFLVLLLMINFACINEYQRIINEKLSGIDNWKNNYRAINSIFSSCIVLILFFVAKGDLPLLFLTAVAVFPVSWFVIEMYTRSEEPFTNVCYNAMGLFYVAVPLSSASLLVFANPEKSYQYQYLLAILIFSWANDSWAYLTGSKWGKTKLFERISPKKSWEGFFGGITAAVVLGFIVYFVFPLLGTAKISLIHYTILAVLSGIASTIGDLTESMIKRNLQLKDTGSALPGHGGWLDRFDGLLFALPIGAFYIMIVQPSPL